MESVQATLHPPLRRYLTLQLQASFLQAVNPKTLPALPVSIQRLTIVTGRHITLLYHIQAFQ
jgi:hypothetical protein